MPDHIHMTQFEREQIRMFGEDIQRLARRHGANVRKHEEAGSMCLALFNLGTAIINASKMDGNFLLWAAFTPRMPNFSDSDTAYGEVE